VIAILFLQIDDIFCVVVRIVQSFVGVPKLAVTDAKGSVEHARLVPKHDVFDLVAFDRVVKHDTFVIFRACVHHLVEHFECWENAEKVFVNLFAILQYVFAKDEDIVDVRTQIGGEIHTILHGEHEEDVPMTPVVKDLTHDFLAEKLFVVHAVVQDDEHVRLHALFD